MTYHRDQLAKEILLVLMAAKPDSLPDVLAQRAFEIADALLRESTKAQERIRDLVAKLDA